MVQSKINPSQNTRSRRLAWATLVLLWAGGVAAATVALVDYGARPGDAGDPPRVWPASLPMTPGHDMPTLVMVAHPRCPCTNASVEQLAQLMSHAHGRVQAFVILSRPVDARGDIEWSQVRLRRLAERIPGVAVVFDNDGSMAAALGTTTSGHVLIFDPEGALRFSGGITAARGHVGDNLGQSAALSLILDGASTTDRTPVFGCPINAGDDADDNRWADETPCCQTRGGER